MLVSEILSKCLSCIGSLDIKNSVSHSSIDKMPTIDSSFGSYIDKCICICDHIEIMLDNQHSISLLDKCIENIEEFLNI